MNLPKFVTYKEIMLVYQLSSTQAQHKLSTIRAVLSKKRCNNILIAEFCQAENVDRSIFENELKNEMANLYGKKPGNNSQ